MNLRSNNMKNRERTKKGKDYGLDWRKNEEQRMTLKTMTAKTTPSMEACKFKAQPGKGKRKPNES